MLTVSGERGDFCQYTVKPVFLRTLYFGNFAILASSQK